MKKQIKKALSIALMLGMCISATGCINVYTTPEGGLSTAPSAAAAPVAEPSAVTPLPAGGTLLLKVNPQIAVSYDNNGNTTEVTAVNQDGAEILAGYTGYEGKACSDVVGELVSKIDQAGYFVEEIEGTPRQIVIEIEQGSNIPSADFLDGVVGQVQGYVQNRQMANPVNVQGASAYGYSAAAPAYDVDSYGNTIQPPAAVRYDDVIGNTMYDDDGIDGNTLYDTDTPYDDDILGNTLYDDDGIAGNTLYDTDTPYDSNTVYDSNSRYDSNTVYDSNSNYSSNSSYDSNNGYSSYGGSGYSGYDD